LLLNGEDAFITIAKRLCKLRNTLCIKITTVVVDDTQEVGKTHDIFHFRIQSVTRGWKINNKSLTVGFNPTLKKIALLRV